jgi:hypothetical protein
LKVFAVEPTASLVISAADPHPIQALARVSSRRTWMSVLDGDQVDAEPAREMAPLGCEEGTLVGIRPARRWRRLRAETGRMPAGSRASALLRHRRALFVG